jgi:hypothetical protein
VINYRDPLVSISEIQKRRELLAVSDNRDPLVSISELQKREEKIISIVS